VYYLQVRTPTTVISKAETIIMWSEGCSNQNRNRTLSDAIYLLYSEYSNIEVSGKGHTQI